MTEFDEIMFEIVNKLLQTVHEAIAEHLKTMRYGVSKRYYAVYVNTEKVLYGPKHNMAYAKHTDANPTNCRMDNESFADVNLPTQGCLMSGTFVNGPTKCVGTTMGATK